MKLIILNLILSSFILLQVNGYCIYNETPNQIKVVKWKSTVNIDGTLTPIGSPVWIVNPAKKKTIQTVSPNEKYCCVWDDTKCFLMAFTGEEKWTHRIVQVACSNRNDEFTSVEFPRGGYLDIIKSADSSQDNWIKVHGHLNDYMGYWYRCGHENQRFSGVNTDTEYVPAPWWCNAAQTFCSGGVDSCCVGRWDSQEHACNACRSSCGGQCQSGSSDGRIQWQKYGWALGCDLQTGRGMADVHTSSDQCGTKCAATGGCTHFTWTPYNGGTCFMKTGGAFKSNAIYTGDHAMVCGIVGLA